MAIFALLRLHFLLNKIFSVMDDNIFNIDVEKAMKILVRPKDFSLVDAGALYSEKYIADVISGRRFNELIWDRAIKLANEKLKVLNEVWGLPDDT